MKKRGRPRVYDDDAVQTVLAAIRAGVPVARLRRSRPDLPCSGLLRWRAGQDPAFKQKLAAARVAGFAAFAKSELGLDDGSVASAAKWEVVLAKELDGTARHSHLARWDPVRWRSIREKAGGCKIC